MKYLHIAFDILLLLLIALLLYNWFPEKALPQNVAVDYILVHKSRHELLAYSRGVLLKRYQVSFGDSPVGHKEFEGDERTPERVYTINDKNPHSVCYKNLGISYSNAADRAHAKQVGKSPGGDIKIHGLFNGQGYIHKFHRWKNWTNGCIAVTNDEMEELYNAVPIGTKIEIQP